MSDSIEDNSFSVIPVDSVRFVKELYPRLRENDEAIERYRASLELLPPIVIAKDGVLVDGFHRLQAHKRENATEIRAINLGNLSDAEIFRESITRNSKHGQQLSAQDKQLLAGKLYLTFSDIGIPERIKEISAMLAISEKTARNYTKDARAEEKKAMQEKAWDLWLNCETQQAIADEIGISREAISDWLGNFGKLSKYTEHPESLQHFDVWSFHTATNNAGTPSYFGKIPPQVVENLLWLYTEPGQIVFDPFAGGGTTIDVSKAMGRRVWSSDRKPSTPTLPIHEHDITTGWPVDIKETCPDCRGEKPEVKDGEEQPAPCERCNGTGLIQISAPKCPDFILLDPPYWMQAAGMYSADPEDLGNMSLDGFDTAWRSVIDTCHQHQKEDSYLAFIVSPAEDKEHDRVVDLGFMMYQACIDAGYKPHRRVIVTYNTQQATGRQVNWAKENKKLLKLYRDLVVFRR